MRIPNLIDGRVADALEISDAAAVDVDSDEGDGILGSSSLSHAPSTHSRVSYATRLAEPVRLSPKQLQDAGRQGLTADEKRTLRYFGVTEGMTPVYGDTLRKSGLVLPELVDCFLRRWEPEELIHAEVLRQLLDVVQTEKVDESGENKVKPQSLERVRRFATVLLARFFPNALLALYGTLGTLQEKTTLIGYNELARRTQNSVLRDLCHRIGRQEGYHYSRYREIAQIYLVDRTSQAIVRFMVQNTFAIVGATFNSEEDVEFLVRCYFSDPERGMALAQEVDRSIADLPGMAGLTPMQNYVRKILLMSKKEIV